MHDPQPAGLAEHAKKLGCHVVWRCHVGIEEQNEHSRVGWDFLRPYLEPFVDHYVFTDRRFPPDWVPEDRYTTIWPSIDPFSPKNQDMAPENVEAILTHVGLIAGREGDTTFVHTDGSPGRVERMCDIVRTGPPTAPETPMIVQVSRWDIMKDMIGVMDAFAAYVNSGRDAELVLAGPVVSAVADDPEGALVLQDCWNHWRGLPHAIRQRVQLVCLPMHDLEENAAIVNALQRHATIVTQKSLAEGFGLTIAEAMLKGTPVVGERGRRDRRPGDRRRDGAVDPGPDTTSQVSAPCCARFSTMTTCGNASARGHGRGRWRRTSVTPISSVGCTSSTACSPTSDRPRLDRPAHTAGHTRPGRLSPAHAARLTTSPPPTAALRAGMRGDQAVESSHISMHVVHKCS